MVRVGTVDADVHVRGREGQEGGEQPTTAGGRDELRDVVRTLLREELARIQRTEARR